MPISAISEATPPPNDRLSSISTILTKRSLVPGSGIVKRLAASVTVLGRENGLKPAARRQAVCAMSRAYRTRMRELSDKPYLDIWFTPTRAEAAVDALGDDSGLLESALQ